MSTSAATPKFFGGGGWDVRLRLRLRLRIRFKLHQAKLGWGGDLHFDFDFDSPPEGPGPKAQGGFLPTKQPCTSTSTSTSTSPPLVQRAKPGGFPTNQPTKLLQLHFDFDIHFDFMKPEVYLYQPTNQVTSVALRLRLPPLRSLGPKAQGGSTNQPTNKATSVALRLRLRFPLRHLMAPEIRAALETFAFGLGPIINAWCHGKQTTMKTTEKRPYREWGENELDQAGQHRTFFSIEEFSSMFIPRPALQVCLFCSWACLSLACQAIDKQNIDLIMIH